MKLKIKQILPSLVITLLLLVVLEIITTSLFPALGMSKYRLPFNILIVLFLGFKLETPFLPIIILFVQYFHAFFSIEGWETGTFAGVVICLIVSYLRDILHFTNAFVTMTLTQIFQFVWFILASFLIYLRFGEFSYILSKFWRFIPESIMISILAPIFFSLLDKIWRLNDRGILGDEG